MLHHDLPALRTVLYVEDNEINAMLMQALFERRPDLRLLVAPDCATALRRAQGQRLDLLLLDLRLPDGHGCTLLPQLRALPGMHRVPAVAVSAEDMLALNLHGFDDQWPKPLSMVHVLDRLDHWLPQRQTRGAQASPPAARLAPTPGMAMR